MRVPMLVLALTWATTLFVHAQPAPIAAGELPAVDDPSFGPLLSIEAVEIRGNESTAERLIRRALPIRRGDALRAGDPRFRKARFKLLAMGYFRDVALDLRKGSRPGQVVLVVTVKERGTVVLRNLYFGTSLATPWWAGSELAERNFFGTGLGVSGGLVHAARGDIAGARPQWALRLGLEDSSILGTTTGAHGAFVYNRASEPYRVRGAATDAAAANFAAFSYTRTGGRGGLSVDITPLLRMTVDGRFERVDADLPAAPTRELEDGAVAVVDLGLAPGASRVVTASLGFDRDTRPDPVLPFRGDRLTVAAEAGAGWMGSSYTFAVLLARYQRWWPIRSRKHVLSLHLTGGVVLGSAPRFDQLHVSDFSRLLTPRALGLVVSTTAPPDFLDSGTSELGYGEIGASAVVEYSVPLFRSRFGVYGGDLFAGAGVWTLTRRGDPAPGEPAGAAPLDLVIDGGLRVDTEIGIFELTFANALGRVPLP